MTAEPIGLTEADLDALLADATAAEAAGQLEDALASLAVVVAELTERRQVFQYPFEWIARLEAELGDLDAAERVLLVARGIAERAGHRPGMFRMDVARARVACAVPDHARAEALLATLSGDAAPLGPPVAERIAEIAAWIAGLRLADPRGHGVAVLQAELALTIAELWAEQGKYRSALRLVDRAAAAITAAGTAIRGDHVQLLRAEWLLAAGELAEADRWLAQARFGDGVDALRLAVVRGRAALRGGRLAQAIDQLEMLDTAPVTSPRLFAYAAALRVAIQLELNLHDAATETANRAMARLAGTPGTAPLRALLERARRGAVARRRSAIALWELPVLLSDGEPAADAELLAFDPASDAGSRFTAAWTLAANGVLVALERRELAAAAAQHRELERIIRGAESSYIAARVRLSAAIVAYYRGADERTVGELLGVAGQLHDLGARQDEAQATRFAAWASARHGQPAHYAVLAQRASAILDEIAGELAPGPRTLYLMNKWNGRDEFVAGRMERLLSDGRGAPRQPRRSEILEVFHEIDTLTHWPIDDAFGDRDAARLAGATSDMVLGWLAERTALPARAGGGRDFSLRSTLSLWWFPARTMVLHYHVLPDRTYLFRIARRHLDVVVLPVGRVHLTSDMRAAADDPAQLEMLANRLGIAGTLDRFPGIRRLVIVPHDVIAGVPFAALPCRDGSLCDRVSLVQLDRLSRWRRPRRRTHGRFVTVGINSYAGSGYRDLGQPEHEATEVVAAFERADAASYLLGEAATCEAIRAALPDATNLHVAAHGVFDPVHPGDSGIVLRERGGFRTLTLHELRRIELRRIELATLATCRSAESAVLPGRERICLPSALLDAGVRGVIASLWSVEDEPSVAIMTALYRRLRTEPPAVALARVQAAARAAGEPPANWAGLVFYGNE